MSSDVTQPTLRNELVGKNIYKVYQPGKVVLKNINFKMESGHVYGLVAPNGSGKTTLMKCIAGTANFTGSIDYNEIGVGSHFNGKIVHSSLPFFADSTMKVIDFLHASAILKNVNYKDALAMFTKSSSSHLRDSLCKDLSTGEKKTFQLFLDFLSNPEVVLLDEPFNGLDYQARRTVTFNISLLVKQNKIIVISTHVFSDIESLTDKVFIMKDGLLNFYEGERKISEVYDEFFPIENRGGINF